MEASLAVDIISKLGVAGFSILIMYQMFKVFVQWMKEKDISHSKVLKEINDKLFVVIGENTEAIKDNTKAYNRVMEHLNNHKL